MTGKIKVAIAAMLVLLVAALIIAAVGWRREIPVLSKTVYLPAQEMKPATKIQRRQIPVRSIQVLDKRSAGKKMDLPEEVVGDEKKQIVATATLPPHDGETSALAITDTATGETTIMARQESPAFAALENIKEIGVRYGITVNRGQEADVFARWDFLRVSRFHLGIYGEMNTFGDGKAMLSLSCRW